MDHSDCAFVPKSRGNSYNSQSAQDPEICHAISEFTELDGKELRLIDALKRIVGGQMGTILCCLPGRLAYFENEDSRFMLERAKC